MKKAVFLDRDGVINEGIDRLVSPEQFRMIHGSAEAIRKLNDAGFLVIIVTNQPDIAKGLLTMDSLDKIHAKMRKLLDHHGAKIDGIYICPHHPQRGFPGEILSLKIVCSCRKPEPGLLLKAKAGHDIDMAHSWMVGDSKADIIAGERAGVKTIFISAGGGSTSEQEKTLTAKPNHVVHNLAEAVKLILSN